MTTRNARALGRALRYNWRLKERFGPGFFYADDREIRKYLRQVSWRRAK